MLMGEYAVLEGGPGVVCAIGCYAYAHLPSTSTTISSPYVQAAVHQVSAFLKQHGLPMPKSIPYVDTQAFFSHHRKLGLGSSAAVVVASVGVLLAQAGFVPALHLPLIQQLAQRAHQNAQSLQGSGADIMAATWGGFQLIHTPKFAAPFPLHFCLIATTHSASTSTLLKQYETHRQSAHHARDVMNAATQQFLAAWRLQQPENMLHAISQTHAVYAELGGLFHTALLTEEHMWLSNLAQKFGGAAKPSGAGGGDIAVAFFPSPQSMASFCAHVMPPLQVLPYQVSESGISLF